jgi:hypothetical protein
MYKAEAAALEHCNYMSPKVRLAGEGEGSNASDDLRR